MQSLHTGHKKESCSSLGSRVGVSALRMMPWQILRIFMRQSGYLKTKGIHDEELSRINKNAEAHLINEELRAASLCGHK